MPILGPWVRVGISWPILLYGILSLGTEEENRTIPFYNLRAGVNGPVLYGIHSLGEGQTTHICTLRTGISRPALRYGTVSLGMKNRPIHLCSPWAGAIRLTLFHGTLSSENRTTLLWKILSTIP